MAEPDITARLERELQILEARLRTVEDADSPSLRRLGEEFRSYLPMIRRMENELHRLEVEGTRVTQERFRYVEREIVDVANRVDELKDDQKSMRLTVRSVLITALASIAVQVILYFILRASAGG